MTRSPTAIMRAGTHNLIGKCDKIATSCCEQVYVVSSVSGATFPLRCFDRNSLKILYSKQPTAGGQLTDPLALEVQPNQLRVFNNQILYIGNKGDNDQSDPRVWVHDLGLNRQIVATEDSNRKILDAFSTSDGKIFTLTVAYDAISGAGDSIVACYDAAGSVVASTSLAGYGYIAMTANLECTNGFRIYVAGYKLRTTIDPRPEEELEDSVTCLSFNGTSFTKEWTFYEVTSEEEIVPYWGRGYDIHVPTPLESTKGQCYLLSMLLTADLGVYECTARISVIEDGTLLHQWDIELGEGYTINDGMYFNAPSGFGLQPSIGCALRYANCNHWLYFRAHTSNKPSKLYRLNLTTGSTAQEIDTITLDGLQRPHLMGLPCSRGKPNEWTKLLTATKTGLYLIDVDDPTTLLCSTTTAAVDIDFGMTFIIPRMNRELKFSN